MNQFEFFKNYKDFASKVRYISAKTLLQELKSTQSIEVKKSLMLRIIEDLVSSTEDLAMWFVTIHSRNDGNKRFRDDWERILATHIRETNEEATKILLGYTRIKTTDGFLKKMDFPKSKQLQEKLQVEESVVNNAVEAIRNTINLALQTRRDGQQIAVRFHNKVKHGMMVNSDASTNNSWVRDFSVRLTQGRRRVVRRNRNFEIPIDIDKAELMVGTIKANAQGIEALINLLLIDYEYRISSGKIKMWSRNKERVLAEIKKALV
ncbi:MAG: hypothetical protein G01um10145_909 [Microgenomates group bacterium Gr01-1014_5]|nr:MAG: hypothetical protein G01um10145_909 [Microgenomates group bacterium Gr01-1014_5]